MPNSPSDNSTTINDSPTKDQKTCNNVINHSNGNGLNSLSSRESVAEAYAERLRNDLEVQAALQPEVLDRNPDEALRKAVLLPLLEIEPPKDTLMLVVDSVDEGPIPGPGTSAHQVRKIFLRTQQYYFLLFFFFFS